ncbi:MAG TPA: chemotaxis response regulator protein-glutamate methylesterase [Bacillota bacterium]|nr:chemotaxis response regulator protein-glutamate methylesterase [Bacillota bacterium]HPL52809.1 chemotaxis response regulator protein-glutamate methylesterase [Bacillota bacterium]
MPTRKEERIKVLIIDDSAFMRVFISDILKDDADIKIVGTARNGKDGLEKTAELKPDIVVMDIEMPVMNGLEALAEIMKLKPAPKVIMLSSMTYEGGEATIKALALGALDFIAKPAGSADKNDIEYIKDELINRIKSISKSKGSCRIAIQAEESVATTGDKTGYRSDSNLCPKYIIAIGTSTGGPKALQEVLTKLPGDVPAAVLVVQHMPPGFTKLLSERLNSVSHICVKEAEDGEMLKQGWAYIAPGDCHMLINNCGNEEYRILINKEPAVTGHRPSVNVMMKSVAESGHKNIIAVMMTGMGRDGSDGMLKIKEAGGKTIAQDESTSIVYGMPKSAINIGAIDIIVPLHNITKEILKNMGV